MPIHLFIVFCFSSALLWISRWLILVEEKHFLFRFLAKSLIFFLIFILLSTYAANFISSYFWGEPIYDALLIKSIVLLASRYLLFFQHITHFSAMAKAAPQLTYGLSIGFLAVVILVPFIIMLSNKIYKILLADVKKQKLYFFFPVLLLVVYLILINFLIDLYGEKNWRGAMLIDSFFSVSMLPFSEPYRKQKAILDREQFANYQSTTSSKQNLVLIIVDALRGDFLVDKDRPPLFLTQLLKSEYVYAIPEAYSSCSYSVCGIMSILASKNVSDLHKNNVKIYEPLKKAGFRTYAIISGHPNWYGFQEIYAHTFDTYVDSDVSGHPLLDDDIIIDTLPKFNLSDTQPFFLYLRLMSTHEMGVLKTAFMKVSPSGYANRVLQADDYLQKIFNILKDKNLLHNTTIVITSDHGEALGDKREYGHHVSLRRPQIYVPFIIYDETFDYPPNDFASTLDVGPTFVDRVGLPIPDFWDGESLLKNNHQERVLYHIKEGGQKPRMRAITYKKADKIYKEIVTGKRGWSAKVKKEELYELVSDYREGHNVIDTVPEDLLKEIKQKFLEHFEE